MSEHTNPTNTQPNPTAPLPNDDFDFDPADFADLDGMAEKENAGPQSPAPTAPKIKIKYNGADEEYDMSTQQDKVVELMQKGRNYDKVQSELENVKNSEEIQFMSQMAQEAGFKSTKEYMQKLKADIQQDTIVKRAQQLESEGYNPQHALYTAQLEQKAKQDTPRTPSPEDAEITKLTEQFDRLQAEHPETKQFATLNDFPKPVLDMIQKGYTPLEAYKDYLLQTERSKNAIEKQNQENANRDLGSLQSGHKEEKEDPFLAGLFGR
jgi:hypothetical protein